MTFIGGGYFLGVVILGELKKLKKLKELKTIPSRRVLIFGSLHLLMRTIA